jgi:hypothetical protein
MRPTAAPNATQRAVPPNVENADATAPIAAPPPIDARVPSNVTPPETPARTGRHVMMDQGGLGDSTPISVAHVSAAAVAIAAIAAAAHTGAHPGETNAEMTAHDAAAPPFANT